MANGASLSGSGTVPVSVSNTSGIVAPGNSPGTLTVNGNYVQASGGALYIELTNLESFDKLVVSGNATLGGTLNLLFASSFPNAFPATFDFLTTGGTISGFFNQINVVGGLPKGATGYSIVTSSNGNGGQKMSLVVVPEAGTGLLALLGTMASVGLAGRRMLDNKRQ